MVGLEREEKLARALVGASRCLWEGSRLKGKRKPPSKTREFGALGGNRTPDLSLRSASLYPTELPVHICQQFMAREL